MICKMVGGRTLKNHCTIAQVCYNMKIIIKLLVFCYAEKDHS